MKTLAELIDHARSNPGKLSYGSAGVGSMNQLAGELFKSLSGAADIVHVPYKGICQHANEPLCHPGLRSGPMFVG